MKTPNSRGVYDLIPDVKDALWRLYLKRKAEDLLFEEEDHIFLQPGTGRVIRPDTLVKIFQAQLKKHGLPVMRFHDLRHATASILFDRGWTLKDVQTWLRHSNAATTLNIYVHYQRERKLQVAEDLNGLFRPKK